MAHFPSMDTEVERTLAHALAHRRCDLAFAYAKERDVSLYGRGSANPWSVRGVAKKVGVSATTFWKWEGGMSCPRMKTIMDWCDVLGVDFLEKLDEAIQMVKEGRGK